MVSQAEFPSAWFAGRNDGGVGCDVEQKAGQEQQGSHF